LGRLRRSYVGSALQTFTSPYFQRFGSHFADYFDGSGSVFVGSFGLKNRFFVTLKNIFRDTPRPYKMQNFADVVSLYN
jgi:hypothetical protein